MYVSKRLFSRALLVSVAFFSILFSKVGAQSVTCSVFDDGYSALSSPADAIYFATSQKACIPDGSAAGSCKRWFGRCTTSDKTPVLFEVFNDGPSNQTAPSDSIYNRAPESACIPGGTQGGCRRWFGLAATPDGRAVKCYLFNDGNTNRIGPTDSIYYRAPGQVCMPDGSATGACRKWFGSCQVVGPLQPVNGGVYKEASHPEIFVVQNGKKIWIPNADTFAAMGLNWASVQAVPDGTLAQLPRFDIPSLSETPGSLIFPPNGVKLFPLQQIAGTTTVTSRGKEVEISELRGWLRHIGDNGFCNGEGAGADFSYELELDTDWALSKGMDLQKLLRVGNIAHVGMRLQGTARNAVALPTIHVELNSWGWQSIFPPRMKQPADWTHTQSDCPKSIGWPFNPNQPNPLQPLAVTQDQRGPYLRLSGSLVTDSPHDVQTRFGTFFCRYLAICSNDDFVWEGSVPDWAPGMSDNDPMHPARWTEMHPPDLIQECDYQAPRVTVRGLALVARVAATFGPIIPSCESQEFDLAPEAARPPKSVVAYEELRGSYPDVYFPWGENSNNGSWLTNLGDHIHVRAKVCGGALGGSPGRLKALYRVWWSSAP